MYRSIHLKGDTFSKYTSAGSDRNSLSKLSNINIFIGRNNSGKSRFLRGLFSDSSLEYTSDKIDLNQHNIALRKIRAESQKIMDKYRVASIQSMSLDLFTEVNFISSKSKIYELPDKASKALTVNSSSNIVAKSGAYVESPSMVRSSINTAIKSDLATISKITKEAIEKSFRKTIYIPTLRGLRGFKGDDLYSSRTEDDYFKDIELPKDSIYTGLSLYNDVKRLLLGPTEGRKKIRRFEAFLSESFFEGEEVNIIPNIEDNVVHVRIGDKEEHPIYELGDGVQSIIILTYPLFFRAGEELNVCIEEPDLFLHPGFQRIFIQTLCRPEFKSFQFFFTTHSNHFLDMTLDFEKISVYSFSKKDKDKFEIENVASADNRVLEQIGVRNSSVFLSNCTLWVEGITDRIYIRKYLELYLKSNPKKTRYTEDVHYSFVEYGGGNITHWSFLEDADDAHRNINVQNLCGKIFLIADSDGHDLTKVGVTKKELRLESLKRNLGERFYCLQCREIENLLTKEILLSTVAKVEGVDVGGLSIKTVKNKATETTPIGTWIDSCVEGKKRTYAADSGTVNIKVVFAKAAVSCMDSFDELSEEARDMTEKIYAFIEQQNQ
jgi:AAA15 family ATPase/GTPase